MAFRLFLCAGFSTSLVAHCLPAPAMAQLISVRTVPVAAGDQFLVFPSQNLGMGGVAIALEDPWLDPFVNPAKGTGIRGGTFHASPSHFRVSGAGGSGGALATAAHYGAGAWSGGIAVSVQRLEAAKPETPSDAPPGTSEEQPPPLLGESSSVNLYALGVLAVKLPGSPISIGAGVLCADLGALAGVDLLYSPIRGVEQSGHMTDYRIGLTAESDAVGSLEAMLVHNRFYMRHAVTYVRWDTATAGWAIAPYPEQSIDRTSTWGLHLGYVRPLTRTGWRIGVIFTANRKSHPEIPSYDVMGGRRDGGDSRAHNVGIGLSRSGGPTTIAIDLIHERISSHAWIEATEERRSARRITRPGDRVFEDRVRFSNAWLRVGIRREEKRVGLQLGLQLHSIRYRLEQVYTEIRRSKEREEGWVEWTPTWGATLKLEGLEIRYTGRLTAGTGRPGIVPPLRERALATTSPTAGDFVAGPAREPTVREVRVLMHQLWLAIPLGG